MVALALPANVMVKIFNANFFARGDTKTPVKAGMISMGSNVVLNLILFQFFSYFGIALASTLASWVNLGMLWFWLQKEGSLSFDKRLKQTLPRLLLASIVMGGFLWEASSLLLPYFSKSLMKGFISLMLLIGGGGIIYLMGLKLTRAFTYREFLEALNRAERDSKVIDT